jgi:hypothetical protein
MFACHVGAATSHKKVLVSPGMDIIAMYCHKSSPHVIQCHGKFSSKKFLTAHHKSRTVSIPIAALFSGGKSSFIENE